MEPLVEGCEVYGADGQFDVELHVLPDSRLTEWDIAKILGYAAWQDGFEHNEQYFCGGRDILIRREQPYEFGGDIYHALQIGGISFRRSQMDRGWMDMDTSLRPPSKENFMDSEVGKHQSTLRATETGETVIDQETYRPCGSYTTPGLLCKVQGTITAMDHVGFHMGVTPILAYGFYHHEDLASEEGPFGFIVTGTPNVDTPRVSHWLGANPRHATVLPEITTPSFAGLHMQGVAHLQTHIGNQYLLRSGRLVMADWETITPLNGTPKQNAMHRTIDIIRPARDVVTLYSHLRWHLPRDDITKMLYRILTTYAEIFCGDDAPQPDMVHISQSKYGLNERIRDFILEIDERTT